ncbi:HAD family hydrolase [Chachezhania antarctica]|uniref:sulfotransferase-like domain-containing protein n=1 Tax=Chachezhania antarctica TaxID=2340860 RepID=UPI000EB2DC44|nr:HAD family hydrolase [Chachezhania antarctica]|tara:strand:+ start:4777 stop:5490 length:714 start_codon:yes stop_codon:yes gene_type:complete
MRIAMWSGPRNLSTAMMYAFRARGDCAVTDEPFYAAYLAETGLDHPMRDAVIASQPTDAAEVISALTGPAPGERPHWYQKHMTQHMLPVIPTNWMEDMVNVYLIRHPARVIASYSARRERPSRADLGFDRQLELLGKHPGPVIDSHDIRQDPAAALGRLCAEIGLDYTPAMLHWPAGGCPEDGAWAAHWYGAIHASTGFAGAEGPLPELTGKAAALAADLMPVYGAMRSKALRTPQN